MKAEIFAEWLRRQGHQVVRSSSSYWFDASPRVYQAFPYHWVIQPSEQELSSFLRSQRAVGLRYSTPVSHPLGRISYHVVYDGSEYTLDRLDRRTRQNVRRGLSRCRVQALPIQRLAEEGWELEVDTARRQGRHVEIRKEKWRQRYLSACDLDGFEAWGALVEDRLAASLLTFKMDDCCEMLSQQCHGDYIDERVNHALAFTVTHTMMSRPGVSSVFYTLQSLDAPPSVDAFKFRMGYVAKQVRQRVVFHPWLAPLIGPACHAAAEKLRRCKPEIPKLPKIAGMLRFYLEGKSPLLEQQWPECIVRGNDVGVVRS